MRLLYMSMFSVLSLFIAECESTLVQSDPCFNDREIVKEIEELEMTCMMRGETVLLSEEDETSRYSVCNQEDLTFEEGTTYIVSGKVYEMKPNERWPGTPLQVTQIKKK